MHSILRNFLYPCMLDEPLVWIRITYRYHRLKTFRYPLSVSRFLSVFCSLRFSPSLALTLSVSFSCLALALSVFGRLAISHCFFLPPPCLPLSHAKEKIDECLRVGRMPMVLGGKFPSTQSSYCLFVTFCSPPVGTGDGIWRRRELLVMSY